MHDYENNRKDWRRVEGEKQNKKKNENIILG